MLQVLFSGLAIGAIYGLVAMAFGVVYYVTRVINFATGQIMMIAIMLSAGAVQLGLSPVAGVLVGLASASLVSIAIYFVAVKPVLRRSQASFAWLVSTLGVAIVVQALSAIIWGPTSQSYPPLFNGISVKFSGITLSGQEVLSIVIALAAMLGFELFRRKTLFGKIGMAISADPAMAAALGANVTAFAIAAFGIAGALAGVAGVLIGPITFANPYLGDTYGIAGFIALMIGGIEKPVAALGGGLVLGVLAVGANTFINSQASDWFPFLVVIVILLVAPHGMFASRFRFAHELARRVTRLTRLTAGNKGVAS